MLLHVLAQDLRATLVITLNNLEETSLIMRLQILEHYHRCALVIWAHDPPIDTGQSVLLQLTSSQHGITPILK